VVFGVVEGGLWPFAALRVNGSGESGGHLEEHRLKSVPH
jgi:hypothetical protein